MIHDIYWSSSETCRIYHHEYDVYYLFFFFFLIKREQEKFSKFVNTISIDTKHLFTFDLQFVSEMIQVNFSLNQIRRYASSNFSSKIPDFCPHFGIPGVRIEEHCAISDDHLR